MKIKLTNEKLRYIALFEELTGVTPKDCVESKNGRHLTFVIDSEDMGRAIGEKGKNIQRVRERIDKSVDIVEYSSDPKEFLKNIFSSLEIQNVELKEEGDEKSAFIEVKKSDKGRAVGKNGWNIKRARKLSSRHHGMANVSFA